MNGKNLEDQVVTETAQGASYGASVHRKRRRGVRFGDGLVLLRQDQPCAASVFSLAAEYRPCFQRARCERARPFGVRGAGVLSRDRSESSAFRRWSSSVAVNLPMTLIAERDQVSLAVVPGMTAQLFLMDFNVTLRATQLPGPSVPTEHAAADHGIPSLLTAVAWAG
jgi:hypothetical protein